MDLVVGIARVVSSIASNSRKLPACSSFRPAFAERCLRRTFHREMFVAFLAYALAARERALRLSAKVPVHARTEWTKMRQCKSVRQPGCRRGEVPPIVRRSRRGGP